MGMQVIMKNQQDVANGVSLDHVRLRRRMKKKLEYTHPIVAPSSPIKKERKSMDESVVDQVMVTSPSTNAEYTDADIQYHQMSEQVIQDASEMYKEKPNMEDEHNNYMQMTSQEQQRNLFMIMYEDITMLKAYVQKFYKIHIVEAGKERQRCYEEQVFDKSKDLWTLQMRRNRYLKKNSGAKGEKQLKV